MDADEAGTARFEWRRDGWTFKVEVRTVSEFETMLWDDRSAGDPVVVFTADPTVAGSDPEDAVPESLRPDVLAALAGIEGVTSLAGTTETPLAHGVGGPVWYVDIVASAVSAEVLHLIVEKVRATLKKRKDTSGEDWREEQGYR